MNPTIRRAHEEDLARIEQLLAASSLPLDGVPEALTGFSVAEDDDQLIGVVAVEPCGDYGLLRSAAVAPSARNHGVGRRLIKHAIDEARSEGFKSLYLLTTRAEKYVPAFGFEKISRDAAPESIRQHVQFRDACPASATVMVLPLNQ